MLMSTVKTSKLLNQPVEKTKEGRKNHDIFPKEAYLHPRDRVSPACLQINRGPGDRVTRVKNSGSDLRQPSRRAVHTHTHTHTHNTHTGRQTVRRPLWDRKLAVRV